MKGSAAAPFLVFVAPELAVPMDKIQDDFGPRSMPISTRILCESIAPAVLTQQSKRRQLGMGLAKVFRPELQQPAPQSLAAYRQFGPGRSMQVLGGQHSRHFIRI